MILASAARRGGAIGLHFPMYRIACLVFALCVAASGIRGQPDSKIHSADEVWKKLGELEKPRGGDRTTDVGYTPALPKSLAQQERERLQALISEAGNFRKHHASDPRAAAARKIEIMALLEAEQLNLPTSNQELEKLIEGFRADSNVPAEDRFDVAFAAEYRRETASSKANKQPKAGKPGDLKDKVADKLQREFGNIDAVYSLYVSAMHTSAPEASARIARKLQRGSAPAWVKRAADGVVARSSLLGRTVPLTLTTDEEYTVDLGAPTGAVTVVYFWGAADGIADLETLARAYAGFPAGARWIYVGMGASPDTLKAAVQKVPFKGLHCPVADGFGSEAARVLGVMQAPYAYVIDGAGKLVGFGATEDLPAIMNSVGR